MTARAIAEARALSAELIREFGTYGSAERAPDPTPDH